MTKKKYKLPKEIIVLPNKDKNFQESWTRKKMKDPANFPHSYRCVLIAKPGSGKTNLIKNMLLHQDPPFERVILVTQSPMSHEYDDIEVEKIDTIPDEEILLDEIDEETGQPPKQIVIIDDVDLESLNKTDMSNLKKLLKHYSSHFNTSVIMSVHDLKQVPASLRRQCNIYILWRISNESLRIFGQKLNIPNKKLYDMFHDNCKNYHDNFTIDLTVGTPYPYRKNLFEIIDEKAYQENNNDKKTSPKEKNKTESFKIPLLKIKND